MTPQNALNAKRESGTQNVTKQASRHKKIGSTRKRKDGDLTKGRAVEEMRWERDEMVEGGCYVRILI